MIFAVGVVLYNPSIEDLKKIQIYASVFDKVFIFDNSDEMVDIPSYSNCVILGRDGNKGISVALNKITEKALENNIDYLCTMDQDSNFREEDIKKMKKTINQGDNNIAIYSPIVVYDNHAKKNIDGDLSEVNWVITSGSFVNLRLVEKLGIKYDEAYFIDRVDKDYCAQINKTGYKIMRVNHCYLYLLL